MEDSQQGLTATQVRAAGIEDWRQILGQIKARFRTGDFATGLALVNTIGEAAEAANHHPDITLTYTDVIVALRSHDVHGITGRDIELARQISRQAAELGIETDVSGLTQVELGLDTVAGHHLAPFYAALLGAELDQDEPIDASGQVPTCGGRNRPRKTHGGLSPSSRSRSGGTSTCGSRTTTVSVVCALCSRPAADWSAMPPRLPTGSSRTPTATDPASAHPPDAEPPCVLARQRTHPTIHLDVPQTVTR